jgi:hypothetical protein
MIGTVFFFATLTLLFLSLVFLCGGIASVFVENRYQKLHYPLRRCGDRTERLEQHSIKEDCSHCRELKTLVTQ